MYVSSVSSDRKVRLYEVDTGECEKVLVGHSGSLKAVYIDAEDEYAVSCGYDTTIRYMSTQTMVYDSL